LSVYVLNHFGLLGPCVGETLCTDCCCHGLNAEAGQLVDGKRVCCNHLLYFLLLLTISQDESARAAQLRASKQDATLADIVDQPCLVAFQLCLDFLLRAQVVEGNGKSMFVLRY